MEIIKKFGELVSWIFSILIGLLALGGIFAGDWGFALFLAVLAIVIAPPVLKKMSAFVNKSRTAKVLTVGLTAIILLILGGFVVAEQTATQERQRVAQEQEAARQARKEAYLPIKDTILKDVRAALDKKDYSKAVEIAAPYIGLDDTELDELHGKAAGEIQRKASADAEAAKIIEEVKAYETFLDTAEADFKTMKPSEADLDTIRKATTTFYALAESLNKARQNKYILSQSDIAYLKGVEKRLSASQARLLPGLRLGFRKRAGELLWEHDAYVSVSGEGNRIINISAGMFAANANIKTAQEQLQEVLTRLRFKEVRYRWYREADEFTYYKLDTPPDAKLAYLQHGRFQDMAAGH